jgi:hypothetical protein
MGGSAAPGATPHEIFFPHQKKILISVLKGRAMDERAWDNCHSQRDFLAFRRFKLGRKN